MAMAFRLPVPKVLAFSDGFWISGSKGSSPLLAMIFRLVPRVLVFIDTVNNVLGLSQQGKENVSLDFNFGDTINNDLDFQF